MLRCGDTRCRKITDVLVTEGAKPGTKRKHPVCPECHARAVRGFGRGLRAIFPRKATAKPQEG